MEEQFNSDDCAEILTNEQTEKRCEIGAFSVHMSRSKVETTMIVGYARVSTDGQSLEAQQAALKSAGADRVFSEKISGAITDRKALAKAIAALGSGDVLLVTRLDRLARSTRDLFVLAVAFISYSEIKAQFDAIAAKQSATNWIFGTTRECSMK